MTVQPILDKQVQHLLPEIELAFAIRILEQRLLDLYNEGLIYGTVHTCTGQEWVGVAVGRALDQHDFIVSNHRGHGHYLGKTRDFTGLISEIMGRSTGVCKGMGGTQHLCHKGFFSNGILGGMAPVAVGLAFSQKLLRSNGITALMLGDGAMAQGVVYESLNIASKLELPLYLICESNGIAQSTEINKVLAGSIHHRAKAFNISVRQSNTWNFEGLLSDVDAGVAAVREQSKPVFHVVETFRLNPHSKGDDDRPKELINSYWARDPLSRLQTSNDPLIAACYRRAESVVNDAVAMAMSAPSATLPVVPRPVRWDPIPLRSWQPQPGRLVDRINAGLRQGMHQDPRVVLLGEDICDPYGGAFKVTRGLSKEFPGRIFNMPISEPALIGVGSGLALGGMKPIVEIMFGDFLSLAFDQLLNHAAKFRLMYADQVRVPLVVRTPMGGRRGYGPTHSQSIEKHFLGIPDLNVICLNHRLDAEICYEKLLTGEFGPTLLIENKVSYTKESSKGILDGFEYIQTNEDWPTIVIRPKGKADCTILCYGGMLIEAEEAALLLFEEDDILTEVVCSANLYPLNIFTLAQSVARTGRLLTIEEGMSFAGLGAEIIACLNEHGDHNLAGIQFGRLAPCPHPIPAARDAELMQLPDAEAIRKKVKELVL